MFRVDCTCGAYYDVPDRLAGRRVKCKRCGGPIAVAQSEGKSAAPVGVDESGRPSWMPPLVDETGVPKELSPAEEQGPPSMGPGNYWFDCVEGLFFIANRQSLMRFLVMSVIVAFEPLLFLAGPFGLPGIVIIRGWVCCFLFNTVQEASAGERDLPEITFTDGMLADVLAPLVKFIVTWLIVLSPAWAYAHVTGHTLIAMLGDRDPIVLFLVSVGVFFWPIVVLVAAVGNTYSVLRFDFLATAVFRTFLPYLGLLFITFGPLVVVVLGVVFLPKAVEHPLALAMVAEIVQLYIAIVAMRAIGLYYPHFKDRFAWSWG